VSGVHGGHTIDFRLLATKGITLVGRTEACSSGVMRFFLSEMLGVRRTTVTMVAGVLQEAGLIRYRRGRIEIVDRRGLEEASCECYSVIRKRTDQDLPKADI
jgi:Crp-like helix-turn-helix domain